MKGIMNEKAKRKWNGKMRFFGSLLAVLCLLCGCGRKDDALTVYVVQSEALYVNALKKFAEEYPEIKCNIVYLESYEEVKERLDTELMSGAGPDVLLFNSFYSGEDPYKLSMGRALMELDGQMEELPEGSYFDVIMDAGQVNGHQYFVPLSWNLLQAYSSRERIAEGDTADLYAALTAEAGALQGDENNCASSLQLGRADVLNLFLETAGSGLIDTGNGKVSAEKEEIRQAADFVKIFYDNMDKIGTIGERYQNDFAGAVSHFTYLLENYSFMHNLRYYQTVYQKLLNEEMTSAQFGQIGGDGLTVQVIQYGAVNANTRNAEGAWKLLKYLLDAPVAVDFPKYETKSVYYAPVNAAVYEECVKELSEEYGMGPGWRVEPLDEENVRILQEIPGRIERSVLPNVALGKLIQECMEPYFLEKDSFDSCYDNLMQRVTLYLNE